MQDWSRERGDTWSDPNFGTIFFQVVCLVKIWENPECQMFVLRGSLFWNIFVWILVNIFLMFGRFRYVNVRQTNVLRIYRPKKCATDYSSVFVDVRFSSFFDCLMSFTVREFEWISQFWNRFCTACWESSLSDHSLMNCRLACRVALCYEHDNEWPRVNDIPIDCLGGAKWRLKCP